MQAAFVSALLAALTSQAFAVLFITSPTASTTGHGGQTLVVNWMDNGTAPTVNTIGTCDFGLYVGNMQQQTQIQPIATSVDVSKSSSLNFTVDSTIGPNSNEYFIRITSNNFKDPANPMNPYEAFSSKFPLDNMTGQFSPSVQAEISGITSASSGASATPAPVSSSTSAAKISTTTGAASALPASASSSAAKATQSSGATSTMHRNVGVLSVIGAVVGLVGLTL